MSVSVVALSYIASNTKAGEVVQSLWGLNDYEIIMMVQSGDEDAFELMVKKYERLIAKIIHQYNLSYRFDDLYQEGLMVLHRSILKFDASYNKTFTRYFEMNLRRVYMTFIDTMKHRAHVRHLYHNEIRNNVHRIRENSVYYPLHLEEIKKALTPLEYRVYILREVRAIAAEVIAEKLCLSTKTVYNATHRAKAKIRTALAG